MKTNSASKISYLIVALILIAGFCSARADDKTNAVPFSVTHVKAKEAAELVKKGDVVVLDVRTPEEFAEGHIKGATNIDYTSEEFLAQAGKLDRNKTYLLHCATGGRSTRCLPKLEKLGFKKIIHLDGGFVAWEEAGNAVEKK